MEGGRARNRPAGPTRASGGRPRGVCPTAPHGSWRAALRAPPSGVAAVWPPLQWRRPPEPLRKALGADEHTRPPTLKTVDGGLPQAVGRRVRPFDAQSRFYASSSGRPITIPWRTQPTPGFIDDLTARRELAGRLTALGAMSRPRPIQVPRRIPAARRRGRDILGQGGGRGKPGKTGGHFAASDAGRRLEDGATRFGSPPGRVGSGYRSCGAVPDAVFRVRSTSTGPGAAALASYRSTAGSSRSSPVGASTGGWTW